MRRYAWKPVTTAPRRCAGAASDRYNTVKVTKRPDLVSEMESGNDTVGDSNDDTGKVDCTNVCSANHNRNGNE